MNGDKSKGGGTGIESDYYDDDAHGYRIYQPNDGLRLKRVYEPAGDDDGTRVLVDRLWPRGIAKEDANWDIWLKEIAPSNELRKWFAHKKERWPEFRERYEAELRSNSEPVRQLRQLMEKGRVTLVFAAKDELRNQAVVLFEFLTDD